jgi:hypothetical protein
LSAHRLRCAIDAVEPNTVVGNAAATRDAEKHIITRTSAGRTKTLRQNAECDKNEMTQFHGSPPEPGCIGSARSDNPTGEEIFVSP